MNQNLIKCIPEKFRSHITDAYRDDDGIWIEFDKHVGNDMEGSTEYATIHMDTAKEVREEAKWLTLH